MFLGDSCVEVVSVMEGGCHCRQGVKTGRKYESDIAVLHRSEERRVG